ALGLDRFAARRESLVRSLTGIALHVGDRRNSDIQLFGHDLRECRLRARAEFHLATEESDAVVIDREPCIVLRRIAAVDAAQDREAALVVVFSMALCSRDGSS